MTATVTHPLEPVFDHQSRVLILGTMPSPKSRENGFYYSHPQNRFWKVMARLFNTAPLMDNHNRKQFLVEHRIALWDVLQSCEIEGANDGSIRRPVPNDLSSLLSAANIQTIFTTGKKATDLYRVLCYPSTRIQSVYLPSTSPANQKHYPFDALVQAYTVVRDAI